MTLRGNSAEGTLGARWEVQIRSCKTGMRWPNGGVGQRKSGFAVAWVLGLAVCLIHGPRAQAQDAQGYWERTNTVGIFAAYSNDSSHMLLGNAEKRKLLELGAVYNRRILIGHTVNWQYSGEILPVALESDPNGMTVDYQTSPTVTTTVAPFHDPPVSCTPRRFDYSYQNNAGVTYSGSDLIYCHGRRWTMGEAMSPVGFQWNFRPQQRLQPFAVGHGGYMFSTQPIPVVYAGTFNFTFDLGAGVEWFRTASRSFRLEYRYHHISNHGTASGNPGIDNGVLQLTYAFGR